MKVLKLYEHKNNPGGIVNFQLDLEKYFPTSNNTYLHFRTGKIFGHPILSNRIIRYIDLLLSYFYYPVHLLIHSPDVIEINTSFIKKSFIRDFIYLELSVLFAPSANKVIFIHGWDNLFHDYLIKKRKNYLIKFHQNADQIIVLADDFKHQLISSGFSKKKIDTLTTGIDYHSFEKVKKIKSDKTNILFLSRIEKDKGIYEFMQSIPQLIEKHHNLHFNIAGVGNDFEEVINSEVAKSYSEYITFHGYLKGEQKIKLLKMSDIYVFPSSHGEGFPISILEAMGSGLPLIYTSSGGLREKLLDGLNGIEIPPKNVDAIIKATIRLIENPSLRLKMGVTNEKLIRENYDIGAIFLKLEEIYGKKDLKKSKHLA